MRATLWAVVAASLLSVSAAEAASVSIKGKYSASDIKGICARNGGSFYQDTSSNATYGCSKTCTKDGGLCGVDCKAGKCTGFTPRIVKQTRRPEVVLDGATVRAARGRKR